MILFFFFHLQLLKQHFSGQLEFPASTGSPALARLLSPADPETEPKQSGGAGHAELHSGLTQGGLGGKDLFSKCPLILKRPDPAFSVSRGNTTPLKCISELGHEK